MFYLLQELQNAHETLTSAHTKLETEYSEMKQVKEDLESETKNLKVLLQKSEGDASTLESTIYQLRKQINQTVSDINVGTPERFIALVRE